jgi:hypothetical protein
MVMSLPAGRNQKTEKISRDATAALAMNCPQAGA